MDPQDLEPRTVKPKPKDLDLLGVEELKDLREIVHLTEQPPELVAKILRMVDRSEYKRRQAAPGLRVSTKAFGVGRRVPIVMRRTRDVPQEIGAS